MLIKNVYIFSGLGVDERVFRKIDLAEFNPTFIKWIDPIPEESIESYALRLIEQIKNPNPILIGLSFGGIMAIEVSKLLETEKVIIISSAKTKMEIPLYYRIAGKLGVHKWMPFKSLKKSNFITNWFFGTTSKEERLLLREITKDTKPSFVKWALDKILKWSNSEANKNIYHIHGTKDRLLPIRTKDCDLSITNGGHLMIFNKADQLTQILKQQILAPKLVIT